MRSNSRFFFYGIFALIAILGVYFVLATSWNLAPANAKAGDTISMIAFNVSSTSHVNSTSGNVTNLSSVLINITGTAFSGVRNVTNISLTNGSSVFFNDSFTTSPVNITVGLNLSNVSNSANFTVKFTLNSSAAYNKTFGANVTGLGNRTYDSLTGLQFSALPYNSSLVTITESTAPVASPTCSPKDIYIGDKFPCTCSGTDSGATDSGVATSTGTSNSPDGTSIPQTTGAFTYTCTVTDLEGNSGSATAIYAVYSVGGKAGPALPKNSHLWTKITPGAAVIMQITDSEIGVKQIQITVNNEAQNVQITVTKYDGKPAEVTVAKSGKVYQYLQINAQNLENNLDKATVQFRVEKSWVSSNGLTKDKVSVYKLNGNWDRLDTTYVSEDSTHYYYNAELDSFSYFVIAEGPAIVSAPSAGAAEEGRNLTWLWILLALVIAFFVWRMMRKK